MSEYFENVEFPKTPDEFFPSRNSIQSQYIAFADMNLDGKKDIIVHIWGEFENSKSVTTAEKIDDSLILYLSNPKNDQYEIANKKIFGEEKLSLGGAMSRDVEVGDYNSDGYPDIAYAMNLENGRPRGEGFENWFSEIAVVMSNGDGTYRIDIIDIPEYHHTLTTLEIDSQNPIIIFASENSTSDSIAIQYGDNGWNRIKGIPPLTGGRALAFQNKNETIKKNYIFTGLTWNFENKVEQGVWVLEDEIWTLLDTYQITGTNKKANFITWNGMTQEKEIFEINDSKIIDLAIWEASAIDLFNNGEEIVIALLSGSKLSDPSADEFRQNDLQQFNFFVGYNLKENKLTNIDDLITGQSPEAQSYKFSIMDVNNDGYDDLVSYPKDYFLNGEIEKNERILIYLNNGNGRLIRTNDFDYPSINHSGSSDALAFPIADLVDLNQDGILDIFYFASSPASNDQSKLYNNDYIRLLLGRFDQFSVSGKNQTELSKDSELFGSSFDDIITIGPENKYISTGKGNDTVKAFQGRINIFLGEGDDLVSGIYKDNYIDGGSGIDVLKVDFKSSEFRISDAPSAEVRTVYFDSANANILNIERINFSDSKLALDINGNAGTTAKILGAFLGASGIQRADLVGVGLDLLDSGTTYEGFLQAALDAVFGQNPSGATLVNHFYGTLTGQSAPQSLIEQYGSLIDNGSLSPVSLAMQVAENELNLQNIDLVGLASTGIEYT